VVDDETANAFVLPGGKIVVFTGEGQEGLRWGWGWGGELCSCRGGAGYQQNITQAT
jgi:hypothetical protein